MIKNIAGKTPAVSPWRAEASAANSQAASCSSIPPLPRRRRPRVLERRVLPVARLRERPLLRRERLLLERRLLELLRLERTLLERLERALPERRERLLLDLLVAIGYCLLS